MKRLSEEEKQLWQRFTQDVERLRSEENQHSLTQDHPGEQNAARVQAIHLHQKATPSYPPSELSSQWSPESLFKGAAMPTPSHHPSLKADEVAGIDGKMAQRFRRGKLPIDATLDLHGLGLESAQSAFMRFVQHANHTGFRVIRVITGHGIGRAEGGGILREAFPRWVNLPEIRHIILSFTQTRPQDGGQGAYLLSLRKSRH